MGSATPPPVRWGDYIEPPDAPFLVQRGVVFANVAYRSGERRSFLFGCAITGYRSDPGVFWAVRQAEQERTLSRIARMAARGILHQAHRRRRFRAIVHFEWATAPRYRMEGERP